MCEQEREQLVERARSGDREAFATLVTCYQQAIGGYLRHLTGDEELALDLTQETFVRAFRALPKTRPGLLIQPWLYRIATNLAYDHFRRQRHFTWLPLRMVDHFLRGDTPDAIEERDLVQRALGRMHPEERAVLLICGLEQMPYEQAAAILGGSAAAIRKRFGRAKARFRLLYTELAEGSAP